MPEPQEQNKDLEWSLEKFRKRERARQFIMQFEGQLCVYSPSVEQVYSNYTLNFPSKENAKLVVLPNPYAFHDTFISIERTAIRDTGLYIIPGELVGKRGLHMMINNKNGQPPRPIPAVAAINKMLASASSNDPFVPVMIKGDLREFRAEHPCIHLHRIKLSNLHLLSEFERRDVQSTVFRKLDKLNKIIHNFQ
ncbi:hypothetical protein [Salinibius halmophilus]|uniref:hypothetical protein n=1 Tax=Salinibius halmophilus TaxID=1853216 RepID=UPI000E6649D7|nr:hypothetical protein [Salinibius halmophilus]